MEIPRGTGGLKKANILEAEYEAKVEFLMGRECKTKTSHLWGGRREYEYFLELHIIGIFVYFPL